MAVILPLSKSEDASQSHLSISKFISRLRSKRSSKRKARDEPGQDKRPSLLPSPLPLVLPQHQPTLSQLGWTTLTFPQPKSTNTKPPLNHASEAEEMIPGPHPLQSASQALFHAAQQFFNQPDDQKQHWKHRLGSEEGWSKILGEKEFITLRTLAYTPDVLKQPAKTYWDLMGAHLSSTLDRISTSVGLPSTPDAGLSQFIGPCAAMGANEDDKTSTMLRIFRYEGWDSKVVAEPHADLGLLSCVVGDVPGLEVWDGHRFFDIERHYDGPCATMLVGRQLERFSNFRYPAGGHRVVSYGKPASNTILPNAEKPQYRHSIVFVLRAHEPLPITSSSLETPITGPWREPISDTTVGELYEKIRRAHFNINTGLAEREEQRRKVRDGKAGGNGGGGKEDGKEGRGREASG